MRVTGSRLASFSRSASGRYSFSSSESEWEYGLITWHQLRHFGRPAFIDFKNPDFVKYAEAFGAKGYRIEKTEDLVPTIKKAFADNTVVIIDCPVDYRENMKLTERLKKLGEVKP